MGFLRYLFSVNKLNADPHQQEPARLFIGYAENRMPSEYVFAFLETHLWSRTERENRIVHTLSMVKVYRVDLKNSANYYNYNWRAPICPSPIQHKSPERCDGQMECIGQIR